MISLTEGKCDYVHLYYLLDCSHQLGSLKLIQELEQKLNSYDDYDLVKQRDHDLKCFNDNFYLSPLVSSLFYYKPFRPSNVNLLQNQYDELHASMVRYCMPDCSSSGITGLDVQF